MTIFAQRLPVPVVPPANLTAGLRQLYTSLCSGNLSLLLEFNTSGVSIGGEVIMGTVLAANDVLMWSTVNDSTTATSCTGTGLEKSCTLGMQYNQTGNRIYMFYRSQCRPHPFECVTKPWLLKVVEAKSCSRVCLPLVRELEVLSRPFLSASPTLPRGGGGGVPAFFKMVGASF